MFDIGSDWRLNLSLQDLERLSYLNYAGKDQYFDGKKQSIGLGVDYYGLNGAYLRRIGLSAVYSTTDDHLFGVVGSGVSESRDLYQEWIDYLAFQGAENVRVQLSADLRLAEALKLVPSVGIAHRAYNDLGSLDDTTDDSETRPA